MLGLITCGENRPLTNHPLALVLSYLFFGNESTAATGCLLQLFYHHPKAWAPPSFRTRFDELPDQLRQYQPEFPIVFVDMNRKEDDSIWKHQDLESAMDRVPEA